MYTLSTTIELPIAHRLPGAYSGLCVGNRGRDETELFPAGDFGFCHGHNYFITFEVSTNTMNKDFMVMDFKQIKKLIHSEMDKYDHSTILKSGDWLIDKYKEECLNRNVDFNNTRLYVWDYAPTAEYMAYKWYQDFKSIFNKAGIKLSKLNIIVEETSHNKVSYTEDIND